MPRKKKSAPQRGRRGGRRGFRDRSYVSEKDEYEYDGKSFPQDEATNTRYPYNDVMAQNLRDAKVVFVAGDRMRPPTPPDAESSESTREPLRSKEPRPSTYAGGGEEDVLDVLDEGAGRQQPSFFMDSQPDPIAVMRLSSPHIREVSPTPSNSSEEVILFRGRDSAGRAVVRPSFKPTTILDPYDLRIQRIEDEINLKERMLAHSMQTHQRRHDRIDQDGTSRAAHRVDKDLYLADNGKHIQRNIRSRDASHNRKVVTPLDCVRHNVPKGGLISREDAAFADYVANADHNCFAKSAFHWRDLDDHKVDDMDGQIRAKLVDRDVVNNGAVASAPLSSGIDKAPSHDKLATYDVDGLSASDVDCNDALEVLSQRRGSMGFQYLVLPNSGKAEDAKWISKHGLQNQTIAALIEEYEARCQTHVVGSSTECEDDLSDECTEADLDSGDISHEEEDDVDESSHEIAESFSDESIARLLAKQEELGMGSEELVLFDGAPDRSIGVAGQADTHSLPTQQSKRGCASKKSKGDSHLMDTLMDPYNGFDVMDFERPSLRKRSKGMRLELLLDVSDSELEDNMRTTWEHDRKKKSDRKREREELRSKGLLGQKHDGKSDLKVKYPEGMTSSAVGQEIKEFLRSNISSLPLPPMDKAGRKIVHELANVFNLKSKSVGKGTKRFPVLYRTSRTSAFDEQAFQRIELRLPRRYLPRMDVKGKSAAKVMQHSNRGGFSSSGVSYRDGDVVGASAPELGVNNRGRAMLEKMGWSTGTALGALNNKGILQPVSHIVKTTKAGLG